MCTAQKYFYMLYIYVLVYKLCITCVYVIHCNTLIHCTTLACRFGTLPGTKPGLETRKVQGLRKRGGNHDFFMGW